MTAREHETESRECWCEPRIMMVCAECEDWTEAPDDCWKCNGDGIMPHDGSDEDAIIIHGDPR